MMQGFVRVPRSRGPRLDISSETGEKNLGSLVKPGYCRAGRYTGDQNHGASILGPERSRVTCLAGPNAHSSLAGAWKRATHFPGRFSGLPGSNFAL